jgi:N-acetylglutamate synthase-like GNAT family acetyltransferase
MRSIRKAVLEDVGALSDCDREFGFGSRKEFLERGVRRGGGYILEQEGKMFGVAVLEYTFFEHGFVSLLYVSPAARRTGAGETLLQHLASSCQTPKLFSSTNQSNHSMQALFAKAGFLPSGMIYNLDPNDPEIVYYKAVKAAASEAIDSQK